MLVADEGVVVDVDDEFCVRCFGGFSGNLRWCVLGIFIEMSLKVSLFSYFQLIFYLL